MAQIYIIAGISFLAGLIAGLVIQLYKISKLRKELKSTQGYLESEKLKKETFRKENNSLHQLRQASEAELVKRIQQAEALNKKLDEDILLLQKSNEETELLLEAGQPELHAIKLKLIEAQNSIARYKAITGK